MTRTAPATMWVLVLERNSVLAFHPRLKHTVSTPLPDSVVRDLEVKKVTELEKIFVNLVEQNSILSSDPVLFIMGASVLLLEQIPNAVQTTAKDQIDRIVKLAPFDHVSFRTRQNGKNLDLIIVNRELYETVQEILERLGFKVLAVTPAPLAGMPVSPFSDQVGKELLKRSALIRQNSLIFDPERAVEEENSVSSDPRRNKKLLMLLIILGVAVIFLAGLLGKMVLFPDKPPKKTPLPTPTLTTISPSTTPVATMTPEATSSGETSNLKIQVLNASAEPGLAQELREQLLAAGYKTIETGNADLLNSSRIQIVFGSNVGIEAREKVTAEISKTYPKPAVREALTKDFDVVITLTNQSQNGT